MHGFVLYWTLLSAAKIALWGGDNGEVDEEDGCQQECSNWMRNWFLYTRMPKISCAEKTFCNALEGKQDISKTVCIDETIAITNNHLWYKTTSLKTTHSPKRPQTLRISSKGSRIITKGRAIVLVGTRNRRTNRTNNINSSKSRPTPNLTPSPKNLL